MTATSLFAQFAACVLSLMQATIRTFAGTSTSMSATAPANRHSMISRQNKQQKNRSSVSLRDATRNLRQLTRLNAKSAPWFFAWHIDCPRITNAHHSKRKLDAFLTFLDENRKNRKLNSSSPITLSARASIACQYPSPKLLSQK